MYPPYSSPQYFSASACDTPKCLTISAYASCLNIFFSWLNIRPSIWRCIRHATSSNVTVISPKTMWKLLISGCHLSHNVISKVWGTMARVNHLISPWTIPPPTSSPLWDVCVLPLRLLLVALCHSTPTTNHLRWINGLPLIRHIYKKKN